MKVSLRILKDETGLNYNIPHEKDMTEITTIREKVKDLIERESVLRGYL